MERAPRWMKMAELTRRAQVSRSTVHHYRNLGLLPPCHLRGPKLHLFGEQHLNALAEIRRLRAQGVSLGEIKARLVRPTPRRPARPAVVGDADQRLLAHATMMFLRVGYERMRMEDLASELKVAKPTLYRKFRSKQALFLRCVQAVRFTLISPQQRAESAQRSSSEHARDRILAVLERFEAYRGLTRILANLALDRDPRVAARAKGELHDMMTNAEPFLRAQMEAGAIRELDSELLAYALWGALMGAGERMLLDARYSVEQVADFYEDLIERGLAPR